MKEQLRRHLFMAEVSSVRVSTTPLRVSAKIKTRSAVMAGDFLSMFGIRLFEYEGNDQAQGDFEIDQIRGGMHLKEQWIREGFSSYYVVKKNRN